MFHYIFWQKYIYPTYSIFADVSFTFLFISLKQDKTVKAVKIILIKKLTTTNKTEEFIE